jgi:hypothetical protein
MLSVRFIQVTIHDVPCVRKNALCGSYYTERPFLQHKSSRKFLLLYLVQENQSCVRMYSLTVPIAQWARENNCYILFYPKKLLC